jgi:hypothetical protein
MTVPREYAAWFESLGFPEVSFGYSCLKLLSPEKLEEGQTGYSKSPEGDSLCDGAPGSWKPEWTVIGYDTLVGNPVILNTSSLQVMTAMHGEETWEPYPIATSLPAFAAALYAVKQVSAGRESPVALEQNPIPPEERARVLQLIRNASDGEIDVEFWELILESGLD